MRAVTASRMRELDRRTIEDHGVAGEILMERAGEGVAEHVMFLAEARGLAGCRVDCFAGKGNNGGDAFVVSRVLAEAGYAAETWLAADADAVTGDARVHLDRMLAAGVPLHVLPDASAWDALKRERPSGGAIVVDGLLGTGTEGPARGVAAAAIDYVNALAGDASVVAIDIPSGLNADTGECAGPVVRADVTVTFAYPKCGLLAPGAAECVGNVEVQDIGIVGEPDQAGPDEPVLITPSDLRAVFPSRRRVSHKGTYGHALLIGGSSSYRGAMLLAAAAAVRSGAGLVTVLVPGEQACVGAGAVPEAMFQSGRTNVDGALAADCLEVWGRDVSEFDAVLVGPGMTTRPDTRAIVETVLAACTAPVVLDADALNVCAGATELLRDARGPVVVTPHPGEMARLLGIDAASVQADRVGAARQAVARFGGTAVLKGAGTLIAAEGRPLHLNLSGNPGMAKGGMGDVLAGLLAGLLAQGITPFSAACAAVYLHGLAGTLAAWHGSQSGMTAGDVVVELPSAFRRLSGR
jgi:hydroxyethylthiazole kinase-like uncharacterized protein yjeF